VKLAQLARFLYSIAGFENKTPTAYQTRRMKSFV
jgi:hypothetical protein